jgi:L-ascorbate metabolism protein UlaG (beta-lactamase superfamily)
MSTNKYLNEIVSIEQFLELNCDGLYYTGHASVITRINGNNYLFDYVKDSFPYGDKWRFFPALIDKISMNKINGIFVSHVHQDHFDPIFLSSDEINCPIYVIEGRSSFKDALNRYGIKYVNIPVGLKYEIASGVYVHGFLHQSNGVDASCCIGNRNFSVYHGNDNYLATEILQSRDPEFANIDVACLPYAYINWYPQLLDNLSIEEKSNESERLCNFYYEYAIKQAKQLNAKQIIPFGANLVYKDSARSALNMECKTPLDFESYMRRTRGSDEALKFKALFGGDVILKDQDSLVIKSEDLFDEQTYRDVMQEFLSSLINEEKLDEFNNVNQQLSLLPNLEIITPTNYDHYICVCDGETEKGVMINTRNLKITKLDIKYLQSNNCDYHLIKIKNKTLYQEWLTKRVTIEEIIGSREFTMLRMPNIYNKDVLRILTTQI